MMSGNEYSAVSIGKLSVSLLEHLEGVQGDELVKAAALKSAAATISEAAAAKTMLAALSSALNPKR